MAILKQQVLLEKLLENYGKPESERKALYHVLIDAGYSEDAASNPKRVLESASWKELVAQIPHNKLMEKLLSNAMQDKSYLASNQALDMLMKVIGGYTAQKVQIQNPEDDMSDEEIEEEIKRLESKVKK